MSRSIAVLLIGSVFALVSLVGSLEGPCQSQAVSTAAQLYRASTAPLPLLSGF
jgi:hypothetical protein